MPPTAAPLPHQEFSSRRFRTVRTPYFSVKVKKNDGDKARIGVIVGKAAGKTAVLRNFLKRQARSAAGKAVMPGNDVLILFSPAVKNATKKDLREALRGALAKAQS